MPMNWSLIVHLTWQNYQEKKNYCEDDCTFKYEGTGSNLQ
jgi:hypothetical protein